MPPRTPVAQVPPPWDNPHIRTIQPLRPRGRPAKDIARALDTLHRLATGVRWLMAAHGWRVHTLREFLPSQQPNLLGTNWARGTCISLRLQHQDLQGPWLGEEEVMETLLHELVHNVHDAHAAPFYALLGRVEEEWRALRERGYLSFAGPGRRLGPASSGAGTRAAGKGRAIAWHPFAGKGRKLGDGRTRAARQEKGRSPQELAAEAALRRVRDAQACGAGQSPEEEVPRTPEPIVVLLDDEEEDDATPSGSSSSALASPSMDPTPPAKSPGVHRWCCQACGAVNPIEYLCCQQCGEDVA